LGHNRGGQLREARLITARRPAVRCALSADTLADCAGADGLLYAAQGRRQGAPRIGTGLELASAGGQAVVFRSALLGEVAHVPAARNRRVLAATRRSHAGLIPGAARTRPTSCLAWSWSAPTASSTCPPTSLASSRRISGCCGPAAGWASATSLPTRASIPASWPRPEQRAGCGGTLTQAQYRDLLQATGFTAVSIISTHEAGAGLHSAIIQAAKPTALHT